MNLTRKELAAAAVAGALAVGLVLAIVLDSWQWSLASVAAMMLVLAAVILLTLRRQDATRKAQIKRLERKIDNLALRVVTESEATHRELSGLIEELGRSLRGQNG